MTADGWDPVQYDRFRAERQQPFHDLLAMVKPAPGGRAIDLGCGSGELTVTLHSYVGAVETLGIDRSPSMLASAPDAAGGGVRFEVQDIAAFAAGPRAATGGRFDVIFANASLQWLPNHAALLEQLTDALSDGGQLAFQVPANDDHVAHLVAAELAREPPFCDALAGASIGIRGTLAPERYAEVLDQLGFIDQHVRLQVYGHHLPSAADVVEWVKGTLLVPYREQLDPALYQQFLDRYRTRLLAVAGCGRPYFYPFKRILCWGLRP
ncbi:MAG: methyltransferase domain-containing protein [Actinomycetota bacterium]|nr:methyltransferase domain-containing protein [Actinomycetota bacterium]